MGEGPRSRLKALSLHSSRLVFRTIVRSVREEQKSFEKWIV